MRLMCLPTLAEMREMLGEELYVKFVWMWREREQDVRAVERRARFASLMPNATVAGWPTPAFARVEDREASAIPEHLLPSPAQALHAALLRAPRLADAIEVPKFGGLLEQANADESCEREVVAAGGRRRRRG